MQTPEKLDFATHRQTTLMLVLDMMTVESKDYMMNRLVRLVSGVASVVLGIREQKIIVQISVRGA